MLDPTTPSHYNALFQELKHKGLAVTDVIYSWCLGIDGMAFELAADNREFHLAFLSMVELVRGLFRHQIPIENGITILTDALYEVSGNEDGSCAQSLLLGLMNVIPQEYPIACRNIDIVLSEDDENIARSLAAEILNRDGRDRTVALRNGRRWLRDYQKAPYGTANPTSNNKIKTGGVYLITERLGNV